MPRKPGSATAFGVLNIIFGVLFLLFGLCSGQEMKVTVNQVDLTNELRAHLEREIPGYQTYRLTALVLGFALALGFITSGIGLVLVQNWARYLGAACSVLALVHQMGMVFFHLAMVMPAVNRFVAAMPLGFVVGILSIFIIGAAAVGVIYNVTLLIMLLLPGTARAFDRYAQGAHDMDEEFESDRRRPREWDDDDRDDPRPRRRYRDDDDDYDRPRRGRW